MVHLYTQFHPELAKAIIEIALGHITWIIFYYSYDYDRIGLPTPYGMYPDSSYRIHSKGRQSNEEEIIQAISDSILELEAKSDYARNQACVLIHPLFSPYEPTPDHKYLNYSQWSFEEKKKQRDMELNNKNSFNGSSNVIKNEIIYEEIEEEFVLYKFLNDCEENIFREEKSTCKLYLINCEFRYPHKIVSSKLSPEIYSVDKFTVDLIINSLRNNIFPLAYQKRSELQSNNKKKNNNNNNNNSKCVIM